MIDIEVELLNGTSTRVFEVGSWLDTHLPNPPLPEPQRWTIGYSEDGRIGIRFADNRDATYFRLRWS